MTHSILSPATAAAMVTTPATSKALSKYSKSIPFLRRPPLLTGEFAGDVGFDPLNLATNREQLVYMREAEVKHARLAMLVSFYVCTLWLLESVCSYLLGWKLLV